MIEEPVVEQVKPMKRLEQMRIDKELAFKLQGWKPKNLKNKSFANIQELFEKTMKKVNTFVDYRTELLEESSKKAETELEDSSKRASTEARTRE
ncbi:ribonuclease H-like domain-containing protein [Tanacetum coccineum]